MHLRRSLVGVQVGVERDASPCHGTASTVPVTELRRNSTLLAPESSAALTTLGLESMSRIVTLVPAVT